MAATIVEHLRFVRTTERLRSLLPLIQLSARIVGEINELDPELAPELLAIATALDEASAATGRAVTFLDARLDAKEEA